MRRGRPRRRGADRGATSSSSCPALSSPRASVSNVSPSEPMPRRASASSAPAASASARLPKPSRMTPMRSADRAVCISPIPSPRWPRAVCSSRAAFRSVGDSRTSLVSRSASPLRARLSPSSCRPACSAAGTALSSRKLRRVSQPLADLRELGLVHRGGQAAHPVGKIAEGIAHRLDRVVIETLRVELSGDGACFGLQAAGQVV